MCFRPADVSGPKNCPQCGKIIPVIPGMSFPETCSGCGADLTSISPDAADQTRAMNPTSTPSAGAAIQTPAAPKAPTTVKQRYTDE